MKVKNVIQVKLGISMNVDVSAKVKKKKKKKKMCAKKVIFGILLHIAVKIVGMKIEALLTIPWLRVI